jgi:hypothetical protein
MSLKKRENQFIKMILVKILANLVVKLKKRLTAKILDKRNIITNNAKYEEIGT